MEWSDVSAEFDAWPDAIHSLSFLESSEELLGLLTGDLVPANAEADDSSGSDAVNERPNVAVDKDMRIPYSLNGVDALRNTRLDSQTEDTLPRAQKKPKKRRTSNPVKQNIDRLRDAAKEAEAQLALLRSRRHQFVRSRVEGDKTDRIPELEAISVWKDVAARQYRWRRESEVLNEKLRRVLQEQDKTLHRLQRLVKRSHALLKSCTPVTYFPFDAEGTRFARRINELMSITVEMQTHAESVMLSEVSPSSHGGDIVNLQQRIVPCSPQTVAAAVWGYLSQPLGNHDSYFREQIECSSDCIVKSFFVHWDSVDMSANHRGIIVARRVRRESGLEFVVYTAELEGVTPSHPHTDVVTSPHGFRTHGWIVAQRCKGLSASLETSEVSTKNVVNHWECSIRLTCQQTHLLPGTHWLASVSFDTTSGSTGQLIARLSVSPVKCVELHNPRQYS